MKMYIKNMVCHRCILAVRTQLEELGLVYASVVLGEVDLRDHLSDSNRKVLEANLKDLGFEIIDDKKSRIIEQIKTSVIELIYDQNNDLKTNLSVFLSDRLHHDYSSLSNLFSEVEGTTIEKYFISQKIERVKELLIYDELSLSEIAFQLKYSSLAHLSNQFKKATGLTPSYFKQLKGNRRRPIDQV